MSKITQYKPSEVYKTLKETIEANDIIIAKGGVPVSISVIGERGIGKTSVIRELTHDLGRGLYKLNLAQMTEPSELIGYYRPEFLVTKGDQQDWIIESLVLKYKEEGYHYTGKMRTSPCPPGWVVNFKEGDILLLDDYSRGNGLFSQAIMELVNEQTMIGWDLKDKKIQILLSENPDNGEYNVSSNDNAQTDRMLKIHMIWDPQSWASRAEKIGLDERLINFILWKPEVLENKKQDGISASGNVSPRMMDKFLSLVSTIKDWDKHLDKISMFGDISVGKEITSDLINFINKRLDKLPSVEKLIKEYELPVAKAQLTDCCGDSEKDSTNWKAATAAILTTRLYNYMRFNHTNVSKPNIKQYLELLLHTSFSVDQQYLLVKQTVGINNTFASTLAGDSRFISRMTK